MLGGVNQLIWTVAVYAMMIIEMIVSGVAKRVKSATRS
jgi:hypothetical protein